MKRILIMGLSGSGKSTFAKKLHDILGLPLIYLDQYYWKPNWQKTEDEEWEKIVEKLAQGEEWIIEGNYSKAFDIRAKRADAIIYLERSRFLCLYRYFKRIFLKRECGNIEGCKEKPTWKMINWILWEFPQNREKELIEKINLFKKTKSVYILKSEKDIESFLLDTVNNKII